MYVERLWLWRDGWEGSEDISFWQKWPGEKVNCQETNKQTKAGPIIYVWVYVNSVLFSRNSAKVECAGAEVRRLGMLNR